MNQYVKELKFGLLAFEGPNDVINGHVNKLIFGDLVKMFVPLQ